MDVPQTCEKVQQSSSCTAIFHLLTHHLQDNFTALGTKILPISEQILVVKSLAAQVLLGVRINSMEGAFLFRFTSVMWMLFLPA